MVKAHQAIVALESVIVALSLALLTYYRWTISLEMS